MGAGRKTQTITRGENIPWSPMAGNSSVSARNLRKSDLGGVIFGCKHNTMAECLSKQLFGLPYAHFSYVRNIGAGLPLFLFNYSDRKLHGIYEAASHGHICFDAYAWTDGGAERTPFPAQVYICMRTQCQPLTENQFGKVIEDNYYTPQHFWFELDHAQTRGLIALFKTSSPVNSMLAPVALSKKELFPALPATKCVALSKKELFLALPATNWKAIVNQDHLNTETSKPMKDLKPSTDLVNENMFASLHCDDGDSDLASPSKTSPSVVEDMESKEPVSDWEDLAEDNVQNISSGGSPQFKGVVKISQKQHSGNEGLESEEERVLHLLKKLVADRERLELSSKGCIDDSADQCAPRDVHENSRHVLEEPSVLASDLNYGNAEDVENSTASDLNYGNSEDVENSTASDLNHGNAELVQVIKELKEQTENLKKQRAESDREMQRLRDLVRDSGRKIELLKNRVKELESKIDPSMALVDDSLDKFVEQYLDSEDLIYLIGGFDGNSWLSAFDSFSPSLDILTPLKSMSSARSYASAVALDGILFVFGGGDGSSWFDTVECYNQSYNEWTSCPSMLREKGSLAGATLNGNIFAIGGGDGVECFSDVEMFDPALGRWINNKSMLHKRFAPAAAELKGVIYALGGYDGNEYLRSAERFDPREGYWTEFPSMNTRRGCHTLAVLNEKLYCMGGYDGERMVSSVEIFDPRLNSWVMGEPMKFVRGYAATAVLGNSLFAIGGVKDEKSIVDTVEYYKEGAGWTTSGGKAIGNRCFCSAIVL